MALTKCNECGGKISDHAKECPHCGCPVVAVVKLAESQNTSPPIEASTPKIVPEQWYYQDGSQIRGPLSSHQLAELATHGSLRPDHRVRKGTDGHWHMASEVKGLRFATASQTHGSQAGAAVPPAMPAHSETPYLIANKYRDYEEVPWYRRSGVNTLFVLANIFTCGFVPLTLWTCINLLSGEVYYKEKDADGYLKTWSFANKVVAFLIIVFNVIVLVAVLAGP